MLSVFHMLVNNLYIIFGEMSIQVLSPFLILGFLFLVLLMSSYRSSVYILDTKSLSDVWFTNISSPSVGNSVECILMWGCRIVWCTLTSWYLVSHLPVSIIHVSVILLVGFWSWEISIIMWGCRGWGWQAAGTWVSVSREMVGFPAPIGWPGASQSMCTQ